MVHECAAVGCANTRPPIEAKRHWEATGSQRLSRLRTSPVTPVRTAADVHPTPIRPPLDTIIVTVAAVVRPRSGGKRDAGSYAPPWPPASTAPAGPSATCPSAG